MVLLYRIAHRSTHSVRLQKCIAVGILYLLCSTPHDTAKDLLSAVLAIESNTLA